MHQSVYCIYFVHHLSLYIGFVCPSVCLCIIYVFFVCLCFVSMSVHLSISLCVHIVFLSVHLHVSHVYVCCTCCLQSRDRADATVTYTLSSLEACQVLWENCIDHHIFFKKDRPELPPRQSILRRSSKHRFRYVLTLECQLLCYCCCIVYIPNQYTVITR